MSQYSYRYLEHESSELADVCHMLQCKKESVTYYQSKLASLSEHNERLVTKKDVAVDFSRSLAKRGHPSPCDGTVNSEYGECASSPKITVARKRTQTSGCVNLPTRKSARLGGKDT